MLNLQILQEHLSKITYALSYKFKFEFLFHFIVKVISNRIPKL